jgi:hypothetical protein
MFRNLGKVTVWAAVALITSTVGIAAAAVASHSNAPSSTVGQNFSAHDDSTTTTTNGSTTTTVGTTTTTVGTTITSIGLTPVVTDDDGQEATDTEDANSQGTSVGDDSQGATDNEDGNSQGTDDSVDGNSVTTSSVATGDDQGESDSVSVGVTLNTGGD